MELWNQLSDDARQAICTARNLARSQGCYAVTPEHLALGILERHGCLAWQILLEMGVNPADLRAELTDAAVRSSDGGVATDELEYTPAAHRCMQIASIEARRDSASAGRPLEVTTAHLLLGLISPTSMADLRMLRTHGVFYGEVGEILRRLTV